FFFQAEDGIRDLYVTGVQTCALPILIPPVADGAAAPSSPISRTVSLPVVRIGGLPVDPLSSVLAPGLVGVYTVLATVPLTVQGAVTVTLEPGSVSGAAGATSTTGATGEHG